MGDLAALGLTQLEEDVYVALVEHPVSTPAVLAPLLGVGRARVAGALESLVFTRPPFIEDPGASADESVSMVARGVAVRSIYDPDGLEDAGIVAHARDCIRGGEVCRVGRVPVKLDIVDRSVAVLPVTGGDEPVYQVLVVRARPVVEALLALFERYWELAAPLRLGERGWPMPSTAEPGLTAEEREVLSLLSAGQKDDSIAHSLGLADRTVGRRIARLMSLAGVKTRFQLAEAAMRRGWME